jgi:excisionase family DNA binding protein
MTYSPPVLLTIPEVARLLRQSVSALYKMIQRHQLPGVVRLGRRVRVDQRILVHWLDQNRASSLTGGQ